MSYPTSVSPSLASLGKSSSTDIITRPCAVAGVSLDNFRTARPACFPTRCNAVATWGLIEGAQENGWSRCSISCRHARASAGRWRRGGGSPQELKRKIVGHSRGVPDRPTSGAGRLRLMKWVEECPGSGSAVTGGRIAPCRRRRDPRGRPAPIGRRPCHCHPPHHNHRHCHPQNNNHRHCHPPHHNHRHCHPPHHNHRVPSNDCRASPQDYSICVCTRSSSYLEEGVAGEVSRAKVVLELGCDRSFFRIRPDTDLRRGLS